MNRSKLFFFLFLFVALLFSNNLSFAQIPDTVGVVDTLRVGNSTAYPGSQVIVPVYAFNDEPLGAMTVPLKFSSSDLICDSVSFVGTRVANAPLKGDTIDNVNGTIQFYAVTFTQINPGSGLVANLFFTVRQSASLQTVEIDTFSTSNPLVFLDFTYTFSVDMTPAFVKGGITINEKNLAPQIKPIGTQYVVEGDTLTIKILASDPEGDSVKISILNCPDGAFFADSGNGRAVFRWIPPFTGPWSAINSPYKLTFVVSDKRNISKEDVIINVIDKNLESKSYVLEIGADSGLYSDLLTIPVKLTNADSVGGMKLLIHYDQSALSLLNVSKLNTRIDNWEYFQYRLNSPQTGDILILAVADLPSPTSTPPMAPGSGVVANLNFQIILNPCPANLSTAIKYRFADSTDNALSNASGSKLINQEEINYRDGYVFILCPNDVANGQGDNSNLPKDYELSQNYPNPFNPKTEINFALPKESEVSLIIYNIKGQIVNKLMEEQLGAGRYKVTWEGRDSEGNKVASGIYFYSLRAGNYKETKKMIMMK